MMAARPEEVPLSIEPVVGWRAWRLMGDPTEPRLGSMVHGAVWTPQEATPARCAASGGHDHPAPDRGCSCGYYAADSFASLTGARVFSNEVGVLGAIGMWGTVIEHTSGARSQFAYPARLRLVCGPCIAAKVVRDPVTVLVEAGRLLPRCRRHAGMARGMPAATVEAALLDAYAVELLPRPSILRRTRWAIVPEGGAPTPAQIGVWFVTAVFLVIRFLIGAAIALWVFGLAVAIGWGIVSGVFHAVAGDDPGSLSTPSASVMTEATSGSTLWVRGASARQLRGTEPHRGRPPVPKPPNIAITCGVGHGDRIEFVKCSDPRSDLFGFAEQSDPEGIRKDCFGPMDAYTSGPHWSACWIAMPSAWIHPWPSSPNPFVAPLGGA
jgi:hypothetical protein